MTTDPTASLRPLTHDEVRSFRERHFEAYAAERVAAGESAEVARRIAVSQEEEFFPGELPAPGHRLYRVMEEATAVGLLWIGPAPSGGEGCEWVYYVEIDDDKRARGYGRSAMLLAERDSAAHGASELGLIVWGANAAARSLYESLGYETVATSMRKELTPDPRADRACDGPT